MRFRMTSTCALEHSSPRSHPPTTITWVRYSASTYDRVNNSMFKYCCLWIALLCQEIKIFPRSSLQGQCSSHMIRNQNNCSITEQLETLRDSALPTLIRYASSRCTNTVAIKSSPTQHSPCIKKITTYITLGQSRCTNYPSIAIQSARLGTTITFNASQTAIISALLFEHPIITKQDVLRPGLYFLFSDHCVCTAQTQRCGGVTTRLMYPQLSENHFTFF